MINSNFFASLKIKSKFSLLNLLFTLFKVSKLNDCGFKLILSTEYFFIISNFFTFKLSSLPASKVNSFTSVISMFSSNFFKTLSKSSSVKVLGVPPPKYIEDTFLLYVFKKSPTI